MKSTLNSGMTRFMSEITITTGSIAGINKNLGKVVRGREIKVQGNHPK